MRGNDDIRQSGKAGKTLIRAFLFAGGILGAGAFGLARAIIMLSQEMHWLSREPDLGRAYWWVVGGCLVGLLAGVTLVMAGRRKD